MAITGADFMKQYAMFGAMSSNSNQIGGMQPKQGGASVDFGRKSVEGIGGQSEAGKATGVSKFAGANLSFVDRLGKFDNLSTLTKPEAKSVVDGFDSGRANFLDLMA